MLVEAGRGLESWLRRTAQVLEWSIAGGLAHTKHRRSHRGDDGNAVVQGPGRGGERDCATVMEAVRAESVPVVVQPKVGWISAEVLVEEAGRMRGSRDGRETIANGWVKRQ